ncbi:ABC transporter permease subunit [Haloferax mediterranei ATCC 33500]|uniref:ABC transporter permease subunit n=1 Tax=Haloferax mediterranei (strain ATCC 33500 / DSM 1411 / JCM 8866 / NBRC 14739 / NCIMB 2177 / R-4) TaxID=523841 RepID=I3R203_HALMT|nr:ABC transporter permease subunit [Haloferax mediterranei]AFK18263.2 maltose ABC transporter permease protein [Haloferax mediterranei ATCC 33500]AHZ22335.1 maltose ABC transporter permease [Haloferax mediterranei ATCC 33500]EMA02464.1 maltose ABC transporter permease [Haloferax mediterranei ATCC 33500]MDX5988353.1 ABC transporter permease subunit [Haloferax mediterranei ATCC 33500]QCQ74786.1 ABC transporter permease subunit [Haloferax mediterranei ATCC 33500]
MSLLDTIGQKLKDDAQTVAMAPVEAVRDIRYTAVAIQRGEVSPMEPLKTAGATLGALILVCLLLFPIYWILIAALSGTGGSIYSSSGLKLFPEAPSLVPFLWVIGDLIVQGYDIVVDIPVTNVALVFSTPQITLLDVSAIQPGTVGRVAFGSFELFPGFAVEPIENPSAFKSFFWNSLTVAIPTVIIAMSLIVPAAYALSRREFIFRRKILFVYVLLTQVGGGLGIALLIGLYTVYVQLGINDSKLALAVYYAATAVPFNTWLLKTYMDGIPVSYEEAAVVDGAPPWRVVVEVILPLSTAGLATVFIFTFLTGWTEFVVAQTLLGTDNYTLPVGLYSLISEYSIPWARFSAFALTFASPIMLVYLFAQRYIEGGLSFGGVEG